LAAIPTLGRCHRWLSDDEARTLYALACWLPGPFLEIGAWAGKSTCCIALGIRDGGRQIASSPVS